MPRFQLNTLSCLAIVMVLLFSGCAAKNEPVDKSSEGKEKVLTKAIEEKVEILEYSPPLYESSVDGGITVADGTLLVENGCLIIKHDNYKNEAVIKSALVFPENTTSINAGILFHQISAYDQYKIGQDYRFGGFSGTLNDKRIKPHSKCQLNKVWFVA